jgi:hypothetical protein
MFLLGFEGLVIANLVGLAAAKASSDAIIAEGGNDPQPRRTRLPPGYQPHYAAQRASYDPREVRLDASPGGISTPTSASMAATP